MNIWLITVGEPLPTDEGNNRLLRTGILANLLVEKNHNVVWWSSTFNHTEKKHRFLENKSIKIKDNFKLILLHSIGYQSNISIKRLINHYGIAQQFKKLAKLETKPDIILCSLPTLELSLEAANYGKKYSIPVVLDIRDLWPDIFVELAPKHLKTVAKLGLSPLFSILKKSCQQVTAITGITSEIVDWGLKYAQRNKIKYDQDFPLAYSQISLKKDEYINAENFWLDYGLKKNKNQFIVCFFGTIGYQFDLETVIKSAINFNITHPEIIFVICGKGEKLEFYKSLANQNKNIIFSGWVSKTQIYTLMNLSSLAIAPYYNSFDFQLSIPNKVIEYLSAGLPIISSLKGEVQKLIQTYQFGMIYQEKNPHDLLQKIIELKKDNQKLKIMSDNAKKLYEEKFVAEKVYSEMIEYLEEIALCHKQTT